MRTTVGYAGGERADPTYRSIGDHSETVRVEFDPALVSYGELLRIFWESHDPLARSWSRQYRTAVFYTSEAQRRAAVETRDALARELGAEVRTEILPANGFTAAEDYHQKYYLRSEPALLRSLQEAYPSPADLAGSTAAARLNGYVGGNGSIGEFGPEFRRLGLSPEARRRLAELAERRGR